MEVESAVFVLVELKEGKDALGDVIWRLSSAVSHLTQASSLVRDSRRHVGRGGSAFTL